MTCLDNQNNLDLDLDLIQFQDSNISIISRIWNDNLNHVIWNEFHVPEHNRKALVQKIKTYTKYAIEKD